MKYNMACGEKISALGFGCMRFPVNADGSIDEALTEKMIDYAMEKGVNYYDTAYPYHGGMSELVTGKILKKYPRESFYLASKFPGHQYMEKYDVEAIFEEQLKKCGVEYFDFYLLHNVYEESIKVYRDERWKIIDYLLEQKANGRIRHLGFSSHARLDCLKEFLDYAGDKMEFCQIQLNWLDWTLQSAKEKCDLLTKYDIPVWVMEPVRGGRLVNLTEVQKEKLLSLRPLESIASWSFRYLQTLPCVKLTLSGMSAFEQVEDNIKTFEGGKDLTAEEVKLLYDMAEEMKNSVPCTACRYCVDGCPKGLNIPELIALYNDIRFNPKSANTPAQQLQCLPDDKGPSACVACGACAKICPQHIDIPSVMKELAEASKDLPNWKKISIEREAEAAALRSRLGL